VLSTKPSGEGENAVVGLQYTRLVSLSTSSEARLASALHLPRLSALGIVEGAPGADALVEFVREKVGRVEVGWLAEAGLEGKNREWKGIKVKVGDGGGTGKETD